MTRPTVTLVTEDAYQGLPELYRYADEQQAAGPSGWPLLRYLSLLLDQLDPLAELLTRLTYVPLDERDNFPTDHRFGIPDPWQRFGSGTYGTGTYGGAETSDLVDPATADVAWFPWLAQLLDVNLTGLTPAEQRDRLLDPATEWQHATPSAIIRAVRTAYPAVEYVDTMPAPPWVITLVTDTGDPEDLVAAAEVERPAGFRIVHAYLDDLDLEP